MKRTLTLLLALVMSASALCACSSPDEFSNDEKLSQDYTRSTDPEESFNYNDGAENPPSVYNNYLSYITNFELRMFRNYYSLSEDKNSSFVFSPISSALQLSLISNGASDDTKNEISLALGSDLTIDDLNQCSSYFKSRMEAVSKQTSGEVNELSGKEEEATATEYVKLENNLFFNDTSDIKTKFLQANASFYGEDIFRFMFSDENALTKVNKQFSDFTDKDAISKLDENGSLISITASDISDLWLNPYAETDIEKGSFKATGGDRDVNYMTSFESYIKSEKAQGVIKYTSKNPLKLMLVMPDENISFDEYISDFNHLEYTKLIESFDITKNVNAVIPEFSIKSDGVVKPLSSVLEESGLYTLFTEDAEFSSMTHSNDLVFNEMYEITPSISVSRTGISGTVANNDRTALVKHNKEVNKAETDLKFDRPFIFLLIDNESDIPVYIGTVNN